MPKVLLLLSASLAACGEPCPTPFDPVTMSDPGGAAFGEYMQAHLDAIRVPGAGVALIVQGEITWSGGFGLASVKEELPVRADTIFMLASLSKPSTAATMMAAVEAGMLDLDEPISEVLPFQVESPYHPDELITARQLLQHRSSIADRRSYIWGNYGDGDSEIPLLDYLADYLVPGGPAYRASGNFLEAAPGQVYSYSNIGYALAGLVVEEASGEAFDAISDQVLFAPLLLEDTAWMLADLDESRVAHPHSRRLLGGWRTMNHYGYPDYPNGQLRSTPQELGQILVALHPETAEADSPLRPSTRAEMVSDGLGIQSRLIAGESMIGHGGSDRGVQTQGWLLGSEPTGFVLLLNARIWSQRQEEGRDCIMDGLLGLALATERAPP